MAFRLYYQNRLQLRRKTGIVSTANIELLKATAFKTQSYALRNALLRLAAHQEQLAHSQD